MLCDRKNAKLDCDTRELSLQFAAYAKSEIDKNKNVKRSRTLQNVKKTTMSK